MTQTVTLDRDFSHKTVSHEYNIRWTRIGNASLPPLIFVHGTPWSHVVWQDLALTLSSRYSVYLYDHPGFNLSPKPQRLLDGGDDNAKVDLDGPLKLRAEASAALFRSWKLPSPPHVVAHDNGGLVSLRLLMQHGLQFASLCLIDVVVLGPFGLPFFKLVAENEDVFTAIPQHLSQGFVKGYVNSAMCKPMSAEIENILIAQWLSNGNQGTQRFLQEMIQAHNRDASDIQDKYASVGGQVPIKIIWGKNDAWIPCDTAHKIKEALNAEEVVIVEEAGHLIHYDQPSKLALEVGLWLDGRDSR